MLKLVKAVSIISVLLAVVIVATVGYLMVFGNDALRQREEFLNKLSAIEAFRKVLGSMSKSKTQVSPLVEEAHKLALRINPPKPPEPERKSTGNDRPDKEPVKELIVPKLPVNTRFNLIATCVVTDHPEKSLALINEATKDHWVREGASIGYLTVHRIDDGSIVLYQGDKEHSILNVPQRTLSKLLKRPPVRIESQEPDAELGSRQRRTGLRNEKRKLPQQPGTKEAASRHKNSISNIENLIKGAETSPANAEQNENLALFKTVLDMIQSSQRSKDKMKKRADEAKK